MNSEVRGNSHRRALSLLSLILVAFGWSGASQAADQACNSWKTERDVRLVADLNKDGRADLIGFGDGGYYTALGKGDGRFEKPTRVNAFAVDQGWDESKHTRMLGDLNGDSVPDIVGFGDAGVYVALGNGDGTFDPVEGRFVLPDFGTDRGWTSARHIRLLADLDHDGYADIVGFGNAGVYTALGDGHGGFGTVKYVLNMFGADQGWTPTKNPRFVIDVNRDSFPDIVAFGDVGVLVALGDGHGGFTVLPSTLTDFGTNQGWDPGKHTRLLADLNGDGVPDIVGFGDAGVYTALARGDGTFGPVQPSIPDFGANQGWQATKHVRLAADLNGDGRADIIGFGDAGVYAALRDTNTTFAAPFFALANFGTNQEWDPIRHVRTVADLNGDGRTDIVAFGDRWVWTTMVKASHNKLHPIPFGFQAPVASLDEFVCVEFPFNLAWDSVALGDFPFDPRWRWQLHHDGRPSASMCHWFSNGDGDPSYADCADQIREENLPEDVNGMICRVPSWTGEGFPGHLNWFTATYEGQASWTDSNFDDDWNVALVPTGTAAVMADRFDIHTEFDSDEMDIKDFFGTWWKAVYSAAENGDKFSVKPVFAPNGDIHAIMTGMFGIDCEHAGGPHDCKSELHPVYAMAAHIHDDPTDDAWAMFVRNNGDEGFCSSKLVPDDFRTYTFHFPWRAGKTGVSIRPGTIWGGYPEGVQAPEITWVPDRGIDVTFELPPSDQSPLIEGELHLEWIGQAPVPPLLPVIIARPAPGSEEETDVFTAAVAKVRLDQRQELNGISNWNNKQKHIRTLPLRPAKQVRDLASETGKVISGRRIDPPATAKQTRDLEKMRALCKFAGSKAQASLQQACSRLPQ